MKDHTRLLLEKSDQALTAAQLLHDAGQVEFAASRVYYAMFYVAEALLYERDMAFRRHSAVHAAFGTTYAKTGLLDPKYHRWLLTAFDARLQGDYEVSPNVSGDDVRLSMDRAREFLEAARRFLEASR